MTKSFVSSTVVLDLGLLILVWDYRASTGQQPLECLTDAFDASQNPIHADFLPRLYVHGEVCTQPAYGRGFSAGIARFPSACTTILNAVV